MEPLQLNEISAPHPLPRTIAFTGALLLATAMISSGADLVISLGTQSYGLTACAESSSDQNVEYRASTGLNVQRQEGPSNALAYSPDASPGHFSYTMSGSSTYSGCADQHFSAGVQNVVQNESGTLKLDAEYQGDGGLAYTAADQTDLITFTNATGQPATVTIVYRFLGVLSTSSYTNPFNGQKTFGQAYANLNFQFLGPGSNGGSFRAAIARDGADPANRNRDDLSATDWSQGYTISPNANGQGATYVGSFKLDPGQTVFNLDNQADVTARYATASADFSHTAAIEINVPAGVSFTSESGKFLSAGSRMVNISTRADVLTDTSVAIGGFIVTGTVAKKVIIRGIGPSLADKGVSGVLADPLLELHRKDSSGQDTIIAQNNDWKETQQSDIEASTVPPTNEKESAIVATLDPGSYTAVLRGNAGSTGIGLVEVFDLAASVDSKLANISTRAVVEPDPNALIGGIIGGGNGSQIKVLIRAIGPSLGGSGVGNALQDPVLELRDKNGALVTSNDDWQTDQKADIEATGVAPSDPHESAIVATLQPTNYTAIVRGKNADSGVGLVEVYHLQ